MRAYVCACVLRSCVHACVYMSECLSMNDQKFKVTIRMCMALGHCVFLLSMFEYAGLPYTTYYHYIITPYFLSVTSGRPRVADKHHLVD